MTKRENMLNILRRKGGDHIPFEFSLTTRLLDEFEERHGTRDIAEFYDFDFRRVGIGPSRVELDVQRYYEGRELKPGTYFDANGTAHEPGSVEHFTHYVSPLAGRDTPLEEIENYQLNDRDAAYRYEGLEKRINDIHSRGLAVFAGVGHIFETAWQIRGMEDMLMDFYEAPEKAHCLHERICRQNEVMAERFARAGADIILYGDDVGTQTGMMMSPEIWREFLRPRLAREIRAAKRVNPEVLAWYHSDGDITSIIPELIEAGVDILNPIQPECVDPVALKREYGDRLAFWGTIGTQTTMPFGTPEDVRTAVREMIEKVGFDGGLVLAPTHVLEPEVPWENIEAFVDACREYGRMELVG